VNHAIIDEAQQVVGSPTPQAYTTISRLSRLQTVHTKNNSKLNFGGKLQAVKPLADSPGQNLAEPMSFRLLLV
jgi:hypothetical protein